MRLRHFLSGQNDVLNSFFKPVLLTRKWQWQQLDGGDFQELFLEKMTNMNKKLFDKIILFLLIFLFAEILKANNKQNALQILNILAYGGAGQMKFRIGGESGGEEPNLNDSNWQTVYIGHQWDEPYTNVWFRTTIDVPEHFGGFSIAGRNITLHLYIDNAADIFVNGDSVGTVSEWDGHFMLAENIQPGDRYVIAIRGINKKGSGKLYDVRIEFSGMEKFQQKLQKYVWRLFEAEKNKKHTQKAHYWSEKINQVAENVIASKAYQNGDEDGFVSFLQREMKTLFPLLPQRLGFHRAVYDSNGTLLPWTTWDDALKREMNWYLKCPVENGYPKFVYMTFMDGNYHVERNDFIPAMQNGMGIISYLKYYHYKHRENPRMLRFARYMGDYLVNESLTPNTGKYPRFTRSTGWAGRVPQPPDCGTQKDRPYEVEPDKGGIAGYALLLLYEETGDQKYLNQALQNARVLVRNMRDGSRTESPWPFRVDYRTGKSRGSASSNMSYILRLFDKLIEHGYTEFKAAREKLWHWILNEQIPNLDGDGMLWVQFFEDSSEPDNRISWSPLNLARYLIERKDAIDPMWQEHARSLIEFTNRNFTMIQGGVRICFEQDHDRDPWGGVLSTYGAVLAMYSAATGSDEYKNTAYEALNFCLYAIDNDGCPGELTINKKRGGWQEDAHTDVVHNFMDAIKAFPEWANNRN